MKGHPISYLDEEKFQQEEEVIRVKLLQTIPRSPYPLQDNLEQTIPRGSILSLPLWLATPLINASIAVPILPKAYTPTSRQAILASARNVNLPNLGRKHFFGLGAERAIQWWPALQLSELLYDTFRGRLELMYAHPVGTMSSNTRSYTNTTENITDRLDAEEMQVYKSCGEQRRLFECWVNGKR